MTMPTSGTIKLSDIKAEFTSGGNPLTDYYRGGGNVPDIVLNEDIPTSGSMAITDFYSSSVDGRLLVTGSDFEFAVGYSSILSYGTLALDQLTGTILEFAHYAASELLVFVVSGLHSQTALFTAVSVTGDFVGGADTNVYTSAGFSFIQSDGNSIWSQGSVPSNDGWIVSKNYQIEFSPP